MTQTTAYSVDAFIDDVREIFDTTQDAHVAVSHAGGFRTGG